MQYPYGGPSDPDGPNDNQPYNPQPGGSSDATLPEWPSYPPEQPPIAGQYWPYAPGLPLASQSELTYAGPGQTQVRMPRDEALFIVSRFKRWIAAGAILAFGVLAGLAAGHSTGVTASASSASPPTTPSNSSSQPPDNGGFFNSGNPSNNPSNNPGGGSFFGPGTSGQPPVSGSSVS